MEGYNSFTKLYLNGLKTKTVSSHVLRYFDSSGVVPTQIRFIGKRGSRNNERSKSSLRRSVQSFFDIAYNNEWKSFITLTFNPRLVDSFDKDAVYSAFRSWSRVHIVRKNFCFLAMPELHKSGAIHFHLLCSRPVSSMAFSGHFIKGKDKQLHEVFNLEDWKYGFSTAIELYGDIDTTVNYCLKYVTKQEEPIYNHYYFAGGRSLDRTPLKLYSNEDYDSFEGREYSSSFNANVKFKYLTYK